MIRIQLVPIYICSIVLLSPLGYAFTGETVLTEQEKSDLIDRYRLHEKLPLAARIRLTDLKTGSDFCFNVRSATLIPSNLIQIPCSSMAPNLMGDARPPTGSAIDGRTNTTDHDTGKVAHPETDVYMKLHYRSVGDANTITLKRVAGNVFYQEVSTIDDIESLELWTTDEIGSVEVDWIQLVDNETDFVRCIGVRHQINRNHVNVDAGSNALPCDDFLPRISRRKRQESDDETDGDWGLKVIDANNSVIMESADASPANAPAFASNRIRGHAYGSATGGSPFDDSDVFAGHNSIASDFTPSEYHVTYCVIHGLSIQFTYEATQHDGSKITKQASRRGREHDCSSHTILLKGNGINKVTIVTGTYGATGDPRITAISGIQFFTNGWASPFYGSNVGPTSTESSSSHVLGYLTGRTGYLLDQLQLVWIRPQQYSATTTTTTAATDMCAVQCVNPGGGRECIPKQWFCDGDRDCADGSDEDPKFCVNTCQDSKIKCGDSGTLTCIYKSWMCDGDSDCPDRSDEDPKYCDRMKRLVQPTTTTTTTTTTSTTPATVTQPVDMCAIQCITPGDGRKCIPKRWMCDGDRDCADGSDEDPKYCGVTCEAEKMGCASSGHEPTCIYKSWMCDKDKDCPDGSDEDPKYCDPMRGITTTTTSTTTTASNSSTSVCGVRCVNPGGGRTCIPKHWLCDGDKDCADGSDEDPKYCAAGCQAGHAHCVQPGGGRTCFDRIWMCDGDRDCSDGSDEDPKYCHMITKPSPTACGRYQCANGGTCNQAQQICDCPEGYAGLDCALECGVPRVTPRVRRQAGGGNNSSDDSEALLMIINGVDAVPHSWPWMVWLLVAGSSCGGMLIDDQHVLTAAHCTEETNLNDYSVYVGTVDYGGRMNGQHVAPYHVSKRYQHPGYSKTTIRNDISILKLSQRVPFGDKTGYVCLPRDQSNDVKVGDNVVVTGWGRTNPNRHAGASVPSRLMQTRIEVFGPSNCRYSNFNDQQQICAGGSGLGGTGICSGDSGGPLIQKINGKWVLFGITSYSHRDQCAHPQYADGFTRVKFYRNWINEQLKQS